MAERLIESLESRVFLSAAELIRNGGFEGTVSTTDWVRTGAFQADSRFTNFHAGAGYAYVSGADGNPAVSLAGTMYQQVTIPTTASSVTLNFWTKITTTETTVGNDVLVAKVMDASGTNVLQTLTTLTNLNSSTGYVQRTVGLSRSLIGQTVRIEFDSTSNATLATTFRVDDVSVNAVSPATSNRVVGYLPDYESSLFSRMDFNGLTAANYFSISAGTDGSLSTGGVSSTRLDAEVALLHAAGATVSITVGPTSFSTLAASPTARAAFATNVVNYALAHNLDGVDIDWEPPAGDNVPTYGLLISDLYTVAHPQHMLITAAVNPWTNEIPAAAVNSYMDWLNVMCYDFDFANHSTLSQAISGMTDWTAYGVTKNKLVMGLPFYGRAGTSWGNSVSQTYSSILADYKKINGFLPGPAVDSYLASDGKTYYFNGVTTIEKKAAYVRDNGYGGLMTWELGQDYWNASAAYDTSSLLPVMKAMMNPPAGLTAASGALFNVVGQTLYVDFGTVTASADLGNLNVSVANGATLVLSSAQHVGTLTVASGGSVVANNTLVTRGLSIGATGKLDLKSNRLVIDYTGTSPAATVVPWLALGRNAGTWNGYGIYSSTAAGNAAKTTGIGYAEASALGISTFGGQAVDGTALVLRYTYYGDTDLSGKVDTDDLARTDRGMARGMSGWMNGDFDYNGVVTSADSALINKAFAANGPTIAEPTDLDVDPVAVAAPTAVATDEPAVVVPTVEDVVAAPLVVLSGALKGKVGKAMTFTLSWARAGVVSMRGSSARRFAIDWNGDGKVDQVVTLHAGQVLKLSHVYRTARVNRPVVLGMDGTAVSRVGQVRIV